MASFDDPKFRGGLAKTFGRVRLTAGSNQLELGDGCTLSSVNTAERTITFPDETGTVALVEDIVAGTTTKATTSTLGSVIVPASGHLAVDGSGNVTVPLATGSVFGVVKVTAGNGLGLASGVVTMGLGSASVFGALKVGTNLSVDTGVISLDTSDVPLLDANNSFSGTATFGALVTLSKGLVGTPTGLTYSASMTATMANATVFTVAMLHATSATADLALSASPTAGKVFWVVVSSDHTDDILTFTTHFKTTATVQPGAGKKIAVGFVGDGTDAIEFARTSAGV